jgi:hypothetical protein
VERAYISSEFDLNKYMVLMALFIDCKDFCGDWSHFASLSTSDFARDGTRFKAKAAERHPRRRENREQSCLSAMKSSLFAKPTVRAAGKLFEPVESSSDRVTLEKRTSCGTTSPFTRITHNGWASVAPVTKKGSEKTR